MLDFPKSKIIRRSAIGGAAPLRRLAEHVKAARHFASSLTAKLVILVGIFIALPVIVYGQFQHADSKLRELVTLSIQHRNWLIAQALKPILDRPGHLPNGELSNLLEKYGGDGTNLQLMLQPSARGAEQRFYYVAAVPAISPNQVNTELNELQKRGILDRLSKTCSDDTPLDVEYPGPRGNDQILTSIVPIQTRWGCWALVSSHTTSEFLYTSFARPFWKTPEVRIATMIYLLLAIIAVLIATSVTRSIKHFRHVAREIRQGRGRDQTFASQNVIPELASVAADFDGLTLDLRDIARDIRRAAEDNTHSFKGPVATIEASLQTAKRGLSPDDERAARAITLIQSSVGRLKALVAASQRLDNVTANLIEAPRPKVDLPMITGNVLFRYRELLAERGINIVRSLHEQAYVCADQAILEEVLENIIDNAISFSPRDSIITVTLIKSGKLVDLRIDDQGPGIDPKKIDRVFDRYYSLRPNRQSDAGDRAADTLIPHGGLGLWIVRRNIEALGGTVTAANLPGAGLRIHIVLPQSYD